jgi:hypothetical protein
MNDERTKTRVDLDRISGPITEGLHKFRIVGIEQREGQAAPYFSVQMECVDKGNDEGKLVWDNVSLSPAARWKMEQFLDAMGAPATGEVFFEDYEGEYVQASVIHDLYDGKLQAKVDRLLPFDSDADMPASLDLAALTPPKKSRRKGKSVGEAIDLPDQDPPTE